jgi:hypothetical protein
LLEKHPVRRVGGAEGAPESERARQGKNRFNWGGFPG